MRDTQCIEVETCEDLNMVDDECPGSCEPALCGDGYALADVEECDDGNNVDDDLCMNDCTSNGWYDDFESNDLLTLPWSSDLAWAQASYAVGAGNHTFRWTYVKDGSVNSNSDKVWIYAVYMGIAP